MRNLFSISRKSITVLITVLALAFTTLWYYLFYIPNNEDVLIEQHFRWLQKADENIRAKLVGNDTLLSNLLQQYINNDSNDVSRYITNYQSEGRLTCFTENFKPNADTTIQFGLDRDSSSNKLKFFVSKNDLSKQKKYTVLMNYDFDKFLQPLLIKGLFEHYVVFYEGNYIYEDFHSGLSYNKDKEDSLLKTGNTLKGASITSLKVGGIDYKIFFQPINFFGSKKLIVAGLISQKKIDAEKKQLPPGIVVLAITIALGILIFIPWIKIYFQGKYDRINLRDASESVVVAKLLTSLIVLLLFGYNYPFQPKDPTKAQEQLANYIDTAFRTEINAADSCLNNLDNLIIKDSLFNDIKNVGSNKPKKSIKPGKVFSLNNYTDLDKDDSVIKRNFNAANIYEANWLDADGSLKYTWTKATENNVHSNYKDRDYFKKVKNGNTITLSENAKDSFVFDQLISRTSGSFRSIISKKSSLENLGKDVSASVISLSFNMKSLDSAILPAGYSFAIVDNDGNVRYHSKTERNLNENLLQEFSNKEELNEALQGRFKEMFSTKYYEDEYEVLVRPIKDFPYFLVVMNDQTFPATVQVETFSFTWGMIIIFIAVVILDLIVYIIASSRRSFLKKQYLVTGWLWPRASSYKEYIVATIGNVVTIILLIACFHFHLCSYLTYLFLLLSCIPLTTIFINSLFLKKYKQCENITYQKYKIRCNWYSLIFVFILNVLAIISLVNEYLRLLVFEITLSAIGFGIFYFYSPEVKNNAHKKNKYTHAYALMIFSRLIITSAIPAVFFYVAAFNFENNILSRYKLYDYNLQLQQKYAHNILPDSSYNNAIYTDGYWITSIYKSDSLWFNAHPKWKSLPQNNMLTSNQENEANLFNAFGFYLENTSNINNDNFFHSSSADSSYFFNNFFKTVLHKSKGNNLFIKKGPDATPNFLKISSSNLNYFFPCLFSASGFFFWLLTIIVLGLFYLILHKIIRKTHSLDIEQIPVLTHPEKMLEELLKKKEQSLIWLIGLPTNEVVDHIQTKLINNGYSVEQINLNDIKCDEDKKSFDVSLEQAGTNEATLHLKFNTDKKVAEELNTNSVLNNNEITLLINIENKNDDDKATSKKLGFIKGLLNKNKNIIIISGTHPLYLFETNNINTPGKNINADSSINNQAFALINNFSILTVPLEKNAEVNTDNASKNINLFLNEELKYTEFLASVHNTLLNEFDNKEIEVKEDVLILKIQVLAYNFYTSIWHSLSYDEKFVLYDLAADGLFNITNTFAVSMLINKGLILVDEGHLRIFNKSFRNFTLSSVNDKEIMHLQALNTKHSNWSNLRTPLIIIVMALFVFLAVAQEGLYAKIIGIISGLAAAIPTLLKLLSMVGTPNVKDASADK